MSDAREGPGTAAPADPGRAATDVELRALAVPGYHRPQQARSLATVRRLVSAAWTVMATGPGVRLDAVLAAGHCSASSFYSRFDGVPALVELTGLLALGAAERTLAEGPVALPADDHPVAAATALVFGPHPASGWLPRDVLAAGVWDDGFIATRRRVRTAALQQLALSACAELEGGPVDGDGRVAAGDPCFRRVHTWLHLAAAASDQAELVGTASGAGDALDDLARRTAALGARLFGAPAGTVPGATAGTPDATAAASNALAVPVARVEAAIRSDRGEQAVAELRAATRAALVAGGRELSPAAVAGTVHRSRSAFFDAFGTVELALVDLARTEQVARIPTALFRPRPDVAADEVVAHVARRIRAWQDHHGILGRRLLQVAPDHPALAAELTAQLFDSALLLAAWYGSGLALSVAEAQLAFALLLAAEQHQVVWGQRPAAVLGADALAALLAPVVHPAR